MDASTSSSSGPVASRAHNLFQVYLRLRPHPQSSTGPERFLTVEPPATDAESTAPTHITLNPPNDRRRAIEKFCFTQVFEEEASQLDVFHCTGVVPLVQGVLAPHGGDGTDALLATLGVTGSGKSHTILGSRSQRGLLQLSLDVIFRSLSDSIVDSSNSPSIEASITASDPSEANIFTAGAFLDTVYADMSGPSRHSSRAPTPMIVGTHSSNPPPVRLSALNPSQETQVSELDIPGKFPSSPRARKGPKSLRVVRREDSVAPDVPSTPTKTGQQSAWQNLVNFSPTTRLPQLARGLLSPFRSPKKGFMAATTSARQRSTNTKKSIKGEQHAQGPPPTPRRLLNRPTALPQHPDISGINVSSDPGAEYAILVSMYEVYNDRIFDLLTPAVKSTTTKEYRRRPLLFKSTEYSPDRKVVAGLRKIICSNLNQALLVLEAGLQERRVAGTGTNSVSSRSHGFFCVEVKKRAKSRRNDRTPWGGSTLTIVDLAGSERARDAKTAGATLAEAGKINESLMYLGQCLQMQSDAGSSNKPSVVPFRQCKLTELLFSNSFPANGSHASHRNPQRGVMVVTADPHGDFNATSQILRYSALAREVTVPRIPSITRTILANTNAALPPIPSRGPASSPLSSPTLMHHRPFFPPGTNAGSYTATSPNHQRTFSPCSNASSSDDRATMEIAALEIARLSEEADYLRGSLEAENEKRLEAEAHLMSMSDRLMELEQEIREDCMAEFEQRLVLELARWKTSLELEKERGEEHWDRKVEVLERLHVVVSPASGDENTAAECEDGENKENVLVENLEEENERLRREIAVLKRELTGRSPTKRKPLAERDDVGAAVETAGASSRPSRGTGGGDALNRKMERLRVSDDGGRNSSASGRSVGGSTSPKKMRKLTTKKWDVAAADDDLF